MDWKVSQKNIAAFFLWLLILSTVFLVVSLLSPDPFSLITPQNNKKGESSPPQLSAQDELPPLQSPPLIPLSPMATVAPPILAPDQPPSPPLRPPLPLAIEEECDVHLGGWVKEPREPSYTNESCRTLPVLKNCGKYGKEQEYLHWRWKPDGCDLPRFDPRLFLAIVRGKKLAFVGDSLARNHMESLLCLLSQAETPRNVYKDAGDQFRTWHFPHHNFTLMVMWTEFLVIGTEKTINGKGTSAFDVHLDRVNRAWADKIPFLDYIIVSIGNWFFRKNYMYEKGELIGCVNCNEGNLTDLGIGFAVRRVFRTALRFINGCQECGEGPITLVRTYSPAHFEHGHWFTGGYCNRTRPLDEKEVNLFAGTAWELRKIQLEEVVIAREEGKKRFGVLDLTKAMMLRVDGHPGSHWPAKKNVNDCLHWCLPGPIDMWSDLLLMTLRQD
ncbi:hypothetical protein HPP92_010312 [Vanilla planifolia]|uniref:Trichome birefringence-like N-terminal domain-containing protein n=1 Tax=Vanilla planifolia TaxID=51239 RepID=A0A835V2C9_VANPL|nr:hypothetical protein HPP92_010312 [Vanilla planifolia]